MAGPSPGAEGAPAFAVQPACPRADPNRSPPRFSAPAVLTDPGQAVLRGKPSPPGEEVNR